MKTLLLLASFWMLVSCGDGQTPVRPSLSANTPTMMSGKTNPYFYLDTTNSLSGSDANGNGIRDDIDRVISEWSPSSEVTRGLVQKASAHQKLINYSGDDVTVAINLMEEIFRAEDCLRSLYKLAGIDKSIDLLYLNYDSLLLNTKLRLDAYKRVFQVGQIAGYRIKGVAACGK